MNTLRSTLKDPLRWMCEAIKLLSRGKRYALYARLATAFSYLSPQEGTRVGGEVLARALGVDVSAPSFARAARGCSIRELERLLDPVEYAPFRASIERYGTDCSVYPCFSPHVPPTLLNTGIPPPLLFVVGPKGPLRSRKPWVAIVGSRDATGYGVSVARLLAKHLAGNDVGVISGLARGIDIAAHREALKRGGETAAVLASGFLSLFPEKHRPEAELIAHTSALITEFLPGEPAVPRHFVLRNRIVASLADAIVVVEARLRSGSLITARYGLEAGIPVWAVPGNVGSAQSEGTNMLIRDGALPLHDIDEFLESVATLNRDCGT